MPPPCLIVVAYHYPPDSAIGGARPARFVRYLGDQGWTSLVCTAAGDEAAALPHVVSVPDRSRVYWESAKGSGPAISRRQYVEELFQRRFFYPGAIGLTWWREAAEATMRALSQQRIAPSVVFSSFPPLASSFAGHRLAKRLRIPWVADLRDPVAFGMAVSPSWLPRQSKQRAETELFRDAAAVIINTQAMADAYIERFPQYRHKIHVIWNGFDPAERLRALPIPSRPIHVLSHVGALYLGRDPFQILRSLQRLRDAGHVPARNLRIDLVGYASLDASCLALVERAKAEGWVNHIAHPIPKDEALRITAESDFLFLVQPQSGIQVPGKLFEYLQFGRPILSLAPQDSAIEWILARAGIPHTNVYPTDSEERTDQKLSEFLSFDPTPRAASGWFEQNFNAERQTAQLVEILNGVVASR